MTGTEERPKTILVIDDYPSLGEVVQAELEYEGFLVLTAVRGREGVTILERNPKVDLAIIDIVMPEWNGVETAKRLREINPSLPLLFMTGSHIEPDERHAALLKEALAMSEEQLLLKPFTRMDIAARAIFILYGNGNGNQTLRMSA